MENNVVGVEDQWKETKKKSLEICGVSPLASDLLCVLKKE